MKKLREQAFSHINAQLIESDQKHAKGPELPNPRFIFHNKIPKSGTKSDVDSLNRRSINNEN